MAESPDIAKFFTKKKYGNFVPGGLEEKAFKFLGDYLIIQNEKDQFYAYRLGIKPAKLDDKEGYVCLFHFYCTIDSSKFITRIDDTQFRNMDLIKVLNELNLHITKKYQENTISVVYPFPLWMKENIKLTYQEKRDAFL